MPGQPVSTVQNSGALALGVVSNFRDAYKAAANSATTAPLGRLVEEIPATADQIKMAYFESAPLPSYWRRGRPATSQGFKDVGWSIQVLDWEGSVEWDWRDAADDQTGSLVSRAKEQGGKFWQRDEAVWFQILNASTDASGLPAIPNAADGAACFSATDGASANRFGVSGGNIVSGQSFTSGAGIRAGYQAAVSRIFQFQDTVSQPLIDTGAKNFLVLTAAADLAATNEAFKQMMPAQGATTSTSNAGVSNVLMDAGYSITLATTQRLATGVMIVACTDVPVKPFVRAKRQEPQEIVRLMSNSDEAGHTGKEKVQFIARTGYGLSLPYGLVKVTT